MQRRDFAFAKPGRLLSVLPEALLEGLTNRFACSRYVQSHTAIDPRIVWLIRRRPKRRAGLLRRTYEHTDCAVAAAHRKWRADFKRRVRCARGFWEAASVAAK